MQAAIEHAVREYDNGAISRRQLVGRLAALAFAAASAPEASAQSPSTFQATGLNHIALHTPDVAVTRDFYVKHLGLTVTRDSASSCFLSCGNEFVALFKADEASLDHYCFSIDGYDVAKAEEILKGQNLNPRRQGDRIYFDDPHGIRLQLAAGDHKP